MVCMPSTPPIWIRFASWVSRFDRTQAAIAAFPTITSDAITRPG